MEIEPGRLVELAGAVGFGGIAKAVFDFVRGKRKDDLDEGRAVLQAELDKREMLFNEAKLIIDNHNAREALVAEERVQTNQRVAALEAGALQERKAYREEITELRKQLAEAEERSRERERIQQTEIDDLRAKNRSLEDLVVGLQRQLAQQAQTTFTVLPSSPAMAKTAEAVRRRGETPSVIMGAFSEYLDKLKDVE